jgi:two-component SAPR family response regulator
MYSVESVADVEVRKEQNPQAPWVKKALILALVSYLVTQKINQAALITIVFLVAMFFLR